MIDSHVHFSYKLFDHTFPYVVYDRKEYKIVADGSREGLIEEMKAHGITCCIEPAIDVDSNELLLKLSEEYEGFLHPAVGKHPTRTIDSKHCDFRRVKEFAQNPKIVAIGETGLDYHYSKEQHRHKQKKWFRWQIRLAHRLGLPLILHIRMADEDAIRILRRNKKRLHGGVCHCFHGGPELARIYTEELGLCLGIGGTLLMKPEYSESLEQAVIATPIEYLLLETDSPYVKPMKPGGITGKKWTKARNTSLILPKIVERIAELKHVSPEYVIQMTDENAKRVFRI